MSDGKSQPILLLILRLKLSQQEQSSFERVHPYYLWYCHGYLMEEAGNELPDEISEFSNLNLYRKVKNMCLKENKLLYMQAKQEVICVNISISDNEAQALSLPPKFCVLSNLDIKTFEKEIETMNTKN